jgi:hypothetical protein
VTAHRFFTGQVVDARDGSIAALVGAYEILGTMATIGGDNQYWARSLSDGDRRVVRESDLAKSAN